MNRIYLKLPNFKIIGLISEERVTKVPGLHRKEHYRHTNNTKLQTLVSPSFKYRTAQELFFCPHHHRLEPPQWRPSEGPHTWGLQAMDRHPKHHLICTHILGCWVLLYVHRNRRLIREGVQDGHLDSHSHTAPELITIAEHARSFFDS